MSAHVARDPFGRASLHREPDRRPCAWCGGPFRGHTARPHTGPPDRPCPDCHAHGPTFTYAYEADDGPCPPRMTPGYRPRAFCNLQCLDAYHGRP